VKKINVISLGCSKNLVDSEVLMARLHDCGYTILHDSNKACDIVIINTCGFINDAKEESIDTIFQWVNQRKAGKVEKVYVTGCLSQRYKEELEKEIPEADKYFGVMDFKAIIEEIAPSFGGSFYTPRKLTTPGHFAYLKISEGCDRTCSFCAIPLIRGKNISAPIHQLVDESRWLSQQGVKELVLIAQDLTYYGIDLYKERSLGLLINYLSAIQGIEWIRLLYAYPAGFPKDVIKIMAENTKVCNYIDIPVQHISDKLLRSMRRSHTAAQTRRLIGNFRHAVPDIAIRTSLITAYPGETEKEFQELCDFVREVRFDRLGVFTYSPEEGTSAASLKDSVPQQEKERRFNTLMEIQQQISLEKNKEKIGQTLKVLIDRKEGDLYIGRSQYDAPEVDNEVLISTTKRLLTGSFYDVLITGADFYDVSATY
jgi:ribosomal protein S12 methylthiotransferase